MIVTGACVFAFEFQKQEKKTKTKIYHHPANEILTNDSIDKCGQSSCLYKTL